MKHTPDQIIDSLSQATHSPRGRYAAKDAIYRQLLDRLPQSDLPKKDVLVVHRRRWSIAASIVLVVGLAIAGVYSYRQVLFPGDEAETSVLHSSSAASAQILVFDDTPLSDIVNELKEAYNVNIEISDAEIVNYRITADFSTDEPIEDVLDAICEVGGFVVDATDLGYVIHR